MGLLLFLAGSAFVALPFLHHLKPEWGEPPETLTPGSDDLRAGKRVCLGGIAHEHEPALPSPVDPGERVLWCHAVVNKYPGPHLGKGPPPTRTLKAATWFRLVDENHPDQYVLVDGNRLGAASVTLDHDPERDPAADSEPQAGAQANPLMELFDLFIDISKAMSSANIKVIRPGDKLWISGRLRQGAQGLHLGRWAMVDNVHPGRRHERDLATARLVAWIAGPALMILGLWRILA
ncbi:MAG: hypothetical protein EA370_15310 [Wenzhouxiangella sp.]|nr:MAG: hypothetical protein EA370_15310 [Wenzhouxiangella sp.]